MTTPTLILSRAADLIRDTAAAACESTPARWRRFMTQVCVNDQLDTIGEFKASRLSAWAVLLSPAVASVIEAILRQAAMAYELDGDVQQDENALALAQVLLGEVSDVG